MVHGQQVFGILKKNTNVTFASLSTGKTYIYSTADIENGPWHKSEFKGYLHDISLLTTKDKMYVVYGAVPLFAGNCQKMKMEIFLLEKNLH